MTYHALLSVANCLMSMANGPHSISNQPDSDSSTVYIMYGAICAGITDIVSLGDWSVNFVCIVVWLM